MSMEELLEIVKLFLIKYEKMEKYDRDVVAYYIKKMIMPKIEMRGMEMQPIIPEESD